MKTLYFSDGSNNLYPAIFLLMRISNILSLLTTNTNYNSVLQIVHLIIMTDQYYRNGSGRRQ
ncbi:MAG: hypothetical protein J7502_03230, partial [Flavisolibacter sp.]|nr:hypothetical protein [Flavisolibacter sp.]